MGESREKTAMITAEAMTIECENYNKETQHTHERTTEPKRRMYTAQIGTTWQDPVGRVGDGGESWGRPLKDPPEVCSPNVTTSIP